MVQILNPPGLPAGYVLVKAPTHRKDLSQLVIMKTPSYLPGQYPTQLKPFAGQIKDCPVACAGQTGQNYRLCLKRCASKVAKSPTEKRAAKAAYRKKYMEYKRKLFPRVEVPPRLK
jgi:hypothetical protein